MKEKLLVLVALIAPVLSSAQGIRYQNTVFIAGGFPFATIRVCTEPATGTPCSPLASVFSDPGLTVPLSQPFSADVNGNFSFFANPALTYHVQVSGQGLTTYDIPYITLPGGGGGGGSITGVTAGTGLTGGGTSGNVTLSLLTSCTPNQVLQWSGVAWVCAGVGTGNVSTTPAGAQAIIQPASGGVSTQFNANNFANIRYVTDSWRWVQTDSAGSIGNLSAPGSNTLTLTPCPLGIDVNSAANFYSYKVYISGVGAPEAVQVTSGSCTPGLASGTIVVTTANAHAAGFTVGSATAGIQEAWNDAWVNDSGAAPNANSQAAPYVKLSADLLYTVRAAIYMRGRGGVLDGAGALITCSTRDRCIYVGTTQSFPQVNHHKLYNLSGTSSITVDGVQVSSVAAAAGTYTVATASSHPFVAGDVVDCEYYSQTVSQHWAATVLSAGLTGTQFEVSFGAATFSAGANTFGWCGLLNTFVEDNSDHVVVQDMNIFVSNSAGLGKFSYGIVNDNDQQLQIERLSNRSSAVIQNSANFPNGAMVYQRADAGAAGITYIHDSEITNANCGIGGGNGFVVKDTVCQGFPVFGFRYFGGLQPATIENVYQESTGATTNPLYGIAAQMGMLAGGGPGTRLVGAFPLSGWSPNFASGGGGGAQRNYFVVPHSSTLGTGPVLFIGTAQPLNSGVSITTQWPMTTLQNLQGASTGTVTWDVLVTTGGSATPPNGTGNYAIATAISGSCSSAGMCSFVDTQAAPSSYTVAVQQFLPQFWFWPVNAALNSSTPLIADSIGTAPNAVATQGVLGVSIVATQCPSAGVASQRSPIWVTCLATSNNGGAGTSATVLQQQDQSNNGPPANSKGRLNFGRSLGSLITDLITLQDSNFSKTVATAGLRPSNDSGDIAIGLDQAGGMSERSGTSISRYINVVPTGSNWLERLTATLEAWSIPVQGTSATFNTINNAPQISSGTACPAADDTCFAGVTGSHTTYTITGTFNVSNMIKFTNLDRTVIRCTPNTLFQPAVQMANPLIEIEGGSYVTLDGCEVAGLAYTTGTISVAAGSATATLSGAPPGTTQTLMAGGTLYIPGAAPLPDTSSTHGQGANISTVSGTTVNITTVGGWAGRSVTSVPYRIAYSAKNLVQVLDEECSLGGGGSISGNGTIVTAVFVAGQKCNVRAGQFILIFGTGTFGSGATADSYNRTNQGPVTIVSGPCDGSSAVCTISYPSTLNLGTGSAGTVAIKAHHIYLTNLNVHDSALQCVAIGSQAGATQDILTQVWVEDSMISFCGTSAISPNRMSHVHLSRNHCTVPAMGGVSGACYNLNQTIEGTDEHNEADVEAGGSAFHAAFIYGGAFGDADDFHDLPLQNSASGNVHAYVDTGINVKFSGMTAGAAAVYGSTNPASGSTCIRYEVPEGGTIIGNVCRNVGGLGVLANSRLENLGSGFNTAAQNTSTASCVNAGANGCTTPVGHQMFNADTQAAVAGVQFTSNGNGSSVTFSSGALTTSAGATCTNATVPKCVTDVVTKLEGVASQKVCPVDCTASGSFPAGRVVFMNFPCSPANGANALCISNNGPMNLLTLPVFRVGIGAPSAGDLPAGDLQFCVSSQPNLVAPEACQDVPKIVANNFIYVSFIFPNWGQLFDNPGLQSAGFVAKAGGTSSFIQFWTDDWAIDVPSNKDGPVSITGNSFYRTQGACVGISGGAIANITGNTSVDCGFGGLGPFASRGFVVDNSLTGSTLIKGPPSVGGLITGNSFRNTLGLNANSTCISFNITNSGAMDRFRVNAAGCVDAEWKTIFNPSTATNFTMQDQGKCTMTAGTCPAQTLTFNYTNTPICYATWTGTGALAGAIKVPAPTGTFPTQTVTPASSNGADTAQVNWRCDPN